MELKGCIMEVEKFTDKEVSEMYALMTEFYDNIKKDTFAKDLYDKEYCMVLKDKKGIIRGFSTQKLVHFFVNKKEVHGIFSGDTIIHKNYWGSIEGFKLFTKFFFELGEKYENFYWFLIVKGYKTYKILPTFFQKFYPNYLETTPPEMQILLDGFGKHFYADEYNQQSGILEYKTMKDRLKNGVADITEKKLKDQDIRFFYKKNPNYLKGNDMVCITKFKKDNLRDKVKHRLLGVEKA